MMYHNSQPLMPPWNTTASADTQYQMPLQLTPNSSIHILAKSDENVPANSQSGVHNDWVDLKEKTTEETNKAFKDKPSTVPVDRVQHEVAALKMAQGLLKGAAPVLCHSACQNTFVGKAACHNTLLLHCTCLPMHPCQGLLAFVIVHCPLEHMSHLASCNS